MRDRRAFRETQRVVRGVYKGFLDATKETPLALATFTPIAVPARAVQIGGRAGEIASGIVSKLQFLRNALECLGKRCSEASAGRYLVSDNLRQVQ